jgi:hypothetical protein
MLSGPSITSILGLGAIGLGFLLAFLTYSLLRTERTNNTPIYVFQFFCFALVLVGAFLQYVGNARTETSQTEIQTIKNNLAAAQEKSQSLETSLTSTYEVMARIANTVPKSIEDLEAVNSVLTGNVCEGGNSGIPIWAGKGTQAAALSTTVISNLAAAKSSIEGILPKK